MPVVGDVGEADRHAADAHERPVRAVHAEDRAQVFRGGQTRQHHVAEVLEGVVDGDRIRSAAGGAHAFGCADDRVLAQDERRRVVLAGFGGITVAVGVGIGTGVGVVADDRVGRAGAADRDLVGVTAGSVEGQCDLEGGRSTHGQALPGGDEFVVAVPVVGDVGEADRHAADPHERPVGAVHAEDRAQVFRGGQNFDSTTFPKFSKV